MLRGWTYRLGAPVLFAAAGVALGTLTGLAVAILGAQTGATGPSIVLANADATKPGPNVAGVHTKQAHSTGFAQAAGAGKGASDANHLAATSTPKPISAADAKGSIHLHLFSGNTPSDGEAPTTLTAHGENHPAKPLDHLLKRPEPTEMASTSHAGLPPMTLADEQLNLDDEARPSNFYVEGDLEVADYNPTAGTIVATDGRTFLVGTTIAASNAAPWDEYRSNLHYRCSQTGSCILSRAGAVAPNARLI